MYHNLKLCLLTPLLHTAPSQQPVYLFSVKQVGNVAHKNNYQKYMPFVCTVRCKSVKQRSTNMSMWSSSCWPNFFSGSSKSIDIELMLYLNNGSIVVGGQVQPDRQTIHGCTIPPGHVCVMVTTTWCYLVTIYWAGNGRINTIVI